MLFDAIFLTLFFVTWALLGVLPWLTMGVLRRGQGAIWALPFAVLGGAAGGALTPLLGLDDAKGVGVSMVAAPLGGALLSRAAYHVWDRYDVGEWFARWRVEGEEVVLGGAEAPRGASEDRKDGAVASDEGPGSGEERTVADEERPSR